MTSAYRGGSSPGEVTYRVSELCEEIRDFLNVSFAGLWVSGEVQRLRHSPRGHVYFELVEKDEGDGVKAKLDAVLWRSDATRIKRILGRSGQKLEEGQEIRCMGGVDFYGPAGRIQLIVREVDPLFTLGLMERRRREVLAELEAAGLLDVNARLPFPDLPLTVALITSEGSAAYHDFISTLAGSGYGFRVALIHSSVQGKAAEGELCAALAAAALAAERVGIEAVCLIRGGGSRTDLATFDSREVAMAIAGCPLPVVTGLGHQIDQSIADRVAHLAESTPTKVAELLVARVAEAELRLSEMAGELRRTALLPVMRWREVLAEAEGRLARARSRLLVAEERLGGYQRSLARAGRRRLAAADDERRELAGRIARQAPRLVEHRRGEPDRLARALGAVAGGRLATARATLSGLERLTRDLSPGRTLARGFSITRKADGGVVRSPRDIAAGDPLTTETAGGSFASRVEEA